MTRLEVGAGIGERTFLREPKAEDEIGRLASSLTCGPNYVPDDYGSSIDAQPNDQQMDDLCIVCNKPTVNCTVHG